MPFKILQQFSRDTKGVSNAIVMVLGLVILSIIVANVVLWNYEMNQLDWDRMKESLSITDVTPIHFSSWFTTGYEYAINTGSVINGSYSDTQTVNDIAEVFREGAIFQQEILRPNAVGQYTQWTGEYPGGSQHWDCCEEDPSDDDGSYVMNGASSWKKETYNFQDSTGSGTINWVRIYVRARTEQLGTSTIRTLIRTGGNDYESSNTSLSTSYQDTYTQHDINPNTGTPWTWSEINSLQAGASSKKAEGDQNIRMTTVWLVVEYWTPGEQALDLNGTFNVDLSTYPLSSIETIEIQIRFQTDDTLENWFLKAYNWTTSGYSDLGFNNTSGHTPTGDWDIYSVNMTDKWESYVDNNGTIYLKLQDEQGDSNQTTVSIDFLAVRAVIDGAKMTFQYTGSVTCHLVSLWVNNATNHERYDINIFVNAGETITHIWSEITLPEEPYLIKVVTKRGNIAVYSTD